MGKSKMTGRAKSMPVGLTLGAIGSLVITLILAVIGAKLVESGAVTEGAIGYIAMVTLFLASFVGAVIAVGSIKRQKLMVCALAAMIYYCVLLSMTALCFGGQYQGMGVTALMVLCGGGIAAMTVMRQGRGMGAKKHRRAVHR